MRTGVRQELTSSQPSTTRHKVIACKCMGGRHKCQVVSLAACVDVRRKLTSSHPSTSRVKRLYDIEGLEGKAARFNWCYKSRQQKDRGCKVTSFVAVSMVIRIAMDRRDYAQYLFLAQLSCLAVRSAPLSQLCSWRAMQPNLQTPTIAAHSHTATPHKPQTTKPPISQPYTQHPQLTPRMSGITHSCTQLRPIVCSAAQSLPVFVLDVFHTATWRTASKPQQSRPHNKHPSQKAPLQPPTHFQG